MNLKNRITSPQGLFSFKKAHAKNTYAIMRKITKLKGEIKMKKNLSKWVSIILLGTIVVLMVWMGLNINRLNSNVKELKKANIKNQHTIEELQEDKQELTDVVAELNHKINLMNMFNN